MNAVAHLVLATAAFLATHFVSSTPLRARLVALLGERFYLALYSLLALATLVWMVVAYERAPYAPLWHGLRYLPLLLMPAAFVLLVLGYLARNPTMVLRQRLLDAAEPARGVLRVTRHPIMWAVMLWAGSHVLARGDIKSLIFFGAFLLLAGGGTVAMDRRKAAAFGEDWQRFARATSNVPFLAIAQGRNAFNPGEIGWTRPLAGLALFAVFFVSHPFLFGARPY